MIGRVAPAPRRAAKLVVAECASSSLQLAGGANAVNFFGIGNRSTIRVRLVHGWLVALSSTGQTGLQAAGMEEWMDGWICLTPDKGRNKSKTRPTTHRCFGAS